MNLEDYADARLAGAYLEVTGELGTINMLVTDLLPEGKKGDLDLYVDAFPLIAPAEKGREGSRAPNSEQEGGPPPPHDPE